MFCESFPLEFMATTSSVPQALGEMLKEELSLLIAMAADARCYILIEGAVLGQMQF